MTHNGHQWRFSLPICASFLLCFVYWRYLFFASKPDIIFDAVGYVDVGQLLYTEGWVKFFETGPQREPGYTMLIAFSMKIADMFSIDFIPVLKIFQLLILFITQLLTLVFLKKLRLSSFITAGLILYMGFSPALLNSALSVFSEIITYPFVLLIALAAVRSWNLLLENNSKALIAAAVMGLLFIGLTCVKVIFSYIFLLYLLPFVYLGTKAFFLRRTKQGLLTFAFLFISVVPLQIFISAYKHTNQKYNGYYEFTSRLWLLYGNTERRTTPMPLSRKLAAVASVPGEGACRAFFTSKNCDYWTIVTADGMAYTKRTQFYNQGLPEKENNKYYIQEGIERVRQHPFLYAYFYAIENLKVPFWESTQIGCVTYPLWLKDLFEWPIFKNGLRFGISLLSGIALIFLIQMAWHSRSSVMAGGSEKNKTIIVAFFIVWMIVCFSLLNALVQIIPRYLFPIAPLYFIGAGLFLERLFTRPENRR